MATPIRSTDQEAWLTARREYLTASDVGRAIRSPGYAARLRREKQAGVRTFHGNKYTRFGQEHETGIGLDVSFDPDNEDDQLYMNGDVLWVSDEYPRFAATPDMVNADRSVIGEIKTVKNTLDWGDGDIRPEYYDQVQWQLMVTGARECVFAWRPYEELADGSLVLCGEVRKRRIQRDEARIAELVEFGLAWLEGGAEKPDVEDLLRDRLDVDRRIGELETEKKRLTALIAEQVGESPGSWEYEGLGTVTLSAPSVRRTFDRKRFDADHPGLTADYMTEKTTAPVVRITPAKKEG